MPPLQLIASVVVGWPAAVASLLLVAVGIATDKARAVVIGVIVGTPFLLYLALTPRFQVLAPVVLLLNYASAYAATQGKKALAAILHAPFVLFLIWLARVVLLDG